MQIIAYYSLVDKKVEDQRLAVEAFSSANEAKIIASYIERRARKYSWAKLTQAIEHSTKTGSLLVIAKLGRLEYNVAVTQLLQSSQANFVCLDKPHITRDSIHMAAEIAWDKVQRASQRKRDTFGKLKAQGVKFASARPDHWKGREYLRGAKKGAKASAKARTERAKQAYEYLIPKIQEYRAKGATFNEIVEEFNALGYCTTIGTKFNRPTLVRILQRAEGTKPKKREPVEV